MGPVIGRARDPGHAGLRGQGGRPWLKNYYRPLEGRFSGFLSRNAPSEEARQVVASERREIALYEKYRAFYSYGFYLARRVD